MSPNPKSIAIAYLEACSRKDLQAVEALLAPQMVFVGPAARVTGAAAYLAVLKRLGPVWVSSDVKKIFAEGDDVCAVYDFVTNTPAGRVPIVEWLRIENGLIAAVEIFFDRVSFKPASDELARLATR